MRRTPTDGMKTHRRDPRKEFLAGRMPPPSAATLNRGEGWRSRMDSAGVGANAAKTIVTGAYIAI